MTIEQLKNNRTKTWTIIGIIVSWTTFWMFLFSPFGLLVWIGILIYLIIKRSKLKWYFMLSAWLFVPSCSFLVGTVQYAIGTASIQSIGGPRIFYGIDKETRVVSVSSGCIFVGFEPFVFLANNAAVRLWTNLFGYQRGSYKGVFPTEDEAQEIIKSADTIIVKYNDNFLQFNYSGQIVKVDTSDFNYYRKHSNDFDTVVGKTINHECFVFQQFSSQDQERRRKQIFIVDISKNKLLKMYFDY